MAELNPYENKDGNDYPELINDSFQKEEVKPQKQEPVVPEQPSYDGFDMDFEEEEEKPVKKVPEKKKKKRKTNMPLVLSLICIVLLLAISAFSFVRSFGLQKELDKKTKEHETYVKTTNDRIKQLEETNKSLNEQLNSFKNPQKPDDGNSKKDDQGSDNKTAAGNAYKVIVGMKIRKGPGSDYDLADFSSFPDELQLMCNEGEGRLTLAEGSVVEVLEIKELDNSTWGRIYDNAWICIKNVDGEYAVK